MTSISVIIVTYNSADTVLSCLESFGKRLDASNGVEIIIVDNASNDNTVSVLAEKFPLLPVIRNTANMGFAAAVNRGVAASKSQYVLLLNPDTKLQENFFSELLTFLERLPKPSVVGCRLLNTDGSNQASVWKVPTLLTLWVEMFLPYSISLRLVTEQPAETRQVATVTGAAMAFDKEIFTAVGRLDERFFMYLEDLDYCIRAKKAGYLVYYLMSASAKHVGGKSSSDSMDAFFVNYYSSKIYFFKKHYPGVISALASAVIYFGCSLRVIVYGLTGMRMVNRRFWSLAKSHIVALRKIYH
jgi:GT2 family glycosyltransferase